MPASQSVHRKDARSARPSRAAFRDAAATAPRRDVGAGAAGVRLFLQDREKQASRSRPEVQDPDRPRTADAPVERRGNDRFAVGPGIERFRDNREIEAPEFPPSQNARHRFAPAAASDPGKEPVGASAVDRRPGIADQRFGRSVEGCPKQEPCIRARRGDARRLQPFFRIAEQGFDGEVQEISARRSAWSWVVRASMTSSSPSPARMRSSLWRVRLMRWSVTRPWGKL